MSSMPWRLIQSAGIGEQYVRVRRERSREYMAILRMNLHFVRKNYFGGAFERRIREELVHELF